MKAWKLIGLEVEYGGVSVFSSLRKHKHWGWMFGELEPLEWISEGENRTFFSTTRISFFVKGLI